MLTALLCVRVCSQRWYKETGKTYEERYADYSKEYQAYEADCKKHGEDPEPKVRHQAGFCGLTASMTIQEQLRKLKALKKSGDVRCSPTETLVERGCRAFSTDAVELRSHDSGCV